jgi:hypothetical protein
VFGKLEGGFESESGDEEEDRRERKLISSNVPSLKEGGFMNIIYMQRSVYSL